MADFRGDVETLIKSVGRIKDCFLAGGAITSLFTTAKFVTTIFTSRTKKHSSQPRAVCRRRMLVGCHNPSRHYIYREQDYCLSTYSFSWFQTAEQIFDDFHFTCVMAAIDLETKEFSGTGISSLHVRKYQDRGYSMDEQRIFEGDAGMRLLRDQNLG